MVAMMKELKSLSFLVKDVYRHVLASPLERVSLEQRGRGSSHYKQEGHVAHHDVNCIGKTLVMIAHCKANHLRNIKHVEMLFTAETKSMRRMMFSADFCPSKSFGMIMGEVILTISFT